MLWMRNNSSCRRRYYRPNGFSNFIYYVLIWSSVIIIIIIIEYDYLMAENPFDHDEDDIWSSLYSPFVVIYLSYPFAGN